ncbi:transposase [Streptomyces cyaneofuscatus]|uniref:transposase n=1 Tax=Streptomyces cyaneofuscatus TaxID=66883 RepID=UPI0037F2BC27
MPDRADAVETVWPRAPSQTCAVHLLRNSFRYAARQYWIAQRQAHLRPRTRPSIGRSSPTHGARSIRRSSGSGRTCGRSAPVAPL